MWSFLKVRTRLNEMKTLQTFYLFLLISLIDDFVIYIFRIFWNEACCVGMMCPVINVFSKASFVDGRTVAGIFVTVKLVVRRTRNVIIMFRWISVFSHKALLKFHVVLHRRRQRWIRAVAPIAVSFEHHITFIITLPAQIILHSSLCTMSSPVVQIVLLYSL